MSELNGGPIPNPSNGGPPPAPAYAQPAAPDPGRTLEIVGFILAFFVSPAGIVVSAIGLVKSGKVGRKNGLALAGLILSIVFFIVTVLFLVGPLPRWRLCSPSVPTSAAGCRPSTEGLSPARRNSTSLTNGPVVGGDRFSSRCATNTRAADARSAPYRRRGRRTPPIAPGRLSHCSSACVSWRYRSRAGRCSQIRGRS